MKITCGKCNSNFTIPEDKIPTVKKTIACPKCGGQLVIDPYAAGNLSGQRAFLLEFPELSVPAFSKCNFAEICTPNKKGSYVSSRNKFKIKIIKAVNYLLEKLLTHDEQILRVGQGFAYFPAEVLFGNGYLTMMANNYAILATNRRLLFININYRANKPTHYIFQLPYESLKKASAGSIFGSLTLKSVSGKRRVYSQMKRYVAKELKDFLVRKQGEIEQVEKQQAQPENICPACFMPVPAGHTSCPYCEAPFKKPLVAFLRSLILPGLGDIYLGHKFLGSLELLGSLLFWFLGVSMIMEESAAAGNSGLGDGAVIMVAFFLGLYHLGDATLTYFMAKKGYMLHR